MMINHSVSNEYERIRIKKKKIRNKKKRKKNSQECYRDLPFVYEALMFRKVRHHLICTKKKVVLTFYLNEDD